MLELNLCIHKIKAIKLRGVEDYNSMLLCAWSRYMHGILFASIRLTCISKIYQKTLQSSRFLIAVKKS